MKTPSRSLAGSPPATTTARSPRSWPNNVGAPAPGCPGPRPGSSRCGCPDGIAAYRRPAETVVPDDDDAVVVTISEAERQLGVSKFTIYRWLRDGFITGEQLTPSAPWRIRIDQALRDRIVPKPQPAGSTWTAPHGRSASPGRPCCTRSNAASSPPSTSTADNEKACVSRSFPTRLDCLTTPDERNGSVNHDRPVADAARRVRRRPCRRRRPTWRWSPG